MPVTAKRAKEYRETTMQDGNSFVIAVVEREGGPVRIGPSFPTEDEAFATLRAAIESRIWHGGWVLGYRGCSYAE